ncbi:cation:proton antiporter [uncultured Thiodictyon sp.]|uniref:cation:proton antiporter domain-containing protein n=1 Tax=uncultured Thiodictyon sp. TaxID=1846217 RepID=UPI0025CFB455|nr:cation:proton antiporter [uncultured Thiodictyon sp.]
MDQSAAPQLLTILAASALGVALCLRLRLPPILGYCAAGVLLGPATLGWVPDGPTTRFLAGLGVVLLMFGLGLEFSLPRLRAAKRLVFGWGAAQLALTAPVLALGAGWLGVAPIPAWILGAALALSSTAIALKQLGEQMELPTAHGRTVVGVLLFQDLAAVGLLVGLPLLAGAPVAAPDWLVGTQGAAGHQALRVMAALTLAAALLGALLMLGRRLLPPLLHWVAGTRSLELFMLLSLVLAFAAAGAAGLVGLAPTLGAFTAGLLLGETAFRHQIEEDLRPFRDLMLGVFFVSLGLQLDPAGLAAAPGLVLATLVAAVLVKAAIMAGLMRALGQGAQDAWRTALSLAQGSELGLLVVANAQGLGLLGPALAQPVLGGLVLSMLAGTLLLRFNAQLACLLTQGPRLAGETDALEARIDAASNGFTDHVILCGYGRMGQNLLAILAQEGVTALALDLDPERVRQGAATGAVVLYGNAARPGILRAAGIARARAVAVTVDDAGLALRIVGHLRALWPHLPVLVRSVRGRNDAALIAAGAEVFPEGLEASLSLAGQLLVLLGVAPSRIEARLNAIRAADYQSLRAFIHDSAETPADACDYPEQVRALAIGEGRAAAGQRPGDLGLMGATLVDVRRGAIRLPADLPDTRLRAGDVLIVKGTREAIERAAARLSEGG